MLRMKISTSLLKLGAVFITVYGVEVLFERHLCLFAELVT